MSTLFCVAQNKNPQIAVVVGSAIKQGSKVSPERRQLTLNCR